ncbi:hypothetical protein C7271_06790 [filamentous cyanobacterium CCP5]|nr:hypothetical protein C7271_06790 [filamentous cyanobacterium CCP5]
MTSNLPAAQTLRQLRPLLLEFHKALMEAEKSDYERIHGPIKNRGEYFQLVVSHEWFSWLRPISQFIARMDEVLMSRQDQPPEAFQSLVQEARALLFSSSTGDALKQRYPTAIELDPTIAVLHAQIDALMNPRS